MLNDYLEAYTLSVVLIGDFNPAIVQPFWLANRKLIREQEAQNAKIDIVHNEISKFSIGWASIEVTRDRFEIKTSQAPYFEPLRDLVVEIFKILKETPLKSFGLNHLKYFDLRDKEHHYNFGDKLAPLNNWNQNLNDPRLFNLEIVEIQRKDGKKGQYRIRVQPPDIQLSTNFGVLININDHLDLETENIITKFSENWDLSFKRAEDVSESIWQKVNS